MRDEDFYKIPVTEDAIEIIREFLDTKTYDYAITNLGDFFDEILQFLGIGEDSEEVDWIYEKCIPEFVRLQEKFSDPEIPSLSEIHYDYDYISFEAGGGKGIDVPIDHDNEYDHYDYR